MNFNQLASELLIRSETLCREWFPEGRRRGHEYTIGDLSGAPGDSLKINLNTGLWCDFATGESGGDLISLYAAMNRLEQGEAFRRLTNGHAPECLSRPAPQKHTPPPADIIMPVPEGARQPSLHHRSLGDPSASWVYRDADGRVLGVVARYDQPGQRKQVLPWVYSSTGWITKAFPEPRPLYGLDRLASLPGKQVLIVEGEKAADAAHGFIGASMAVVTWPGGAQALGKVDLEPLRGRTVLLWPDADEAGMEAMQRLAEMLAGVATKVKVLSVDGMPDKWDAADSGFTAETFKAWAKPRARTMGEASYTATAEPLNVFAEMAAPAIHPDMLPPIVADYAFDQAALVGVDPAMIAMPAVVSCAAVIHDGIEIQPKRHETRWRESARLWCAVVGAPSVRKSPSLKRATKPLRKINKALCDANERKAAAYAHAVDAYKDDKKRAKQLGEAPPPVPEEPQRERLIVEDVTVEALSEILKHNARGVLCVQDELTGWFGSMDAYNGGKGANKDRAHWLEIYNGGHRMVDRVLRGNISIPNWSACMIGGIQPDMIRQVAKNMGEDGLMQRFMLIVGRNAGHEEDRPEDGYASRGYDDLIERLFSIQPSDQPVVLSEEAHKIREALNDFASELVEYSSLPGGLKSHLGKWSGLFARLLLTYHVIECAVASRHPCDVPVSGATAARVDALMRRFLLPHAMAFYSDVMGGVGDLEHIRWVAGHILSKELAVLEARDLMQAYRMWRSLDQWRRARVMQALEDYGWLQPTAVPRPGRQMPQSWAVNPAVHSLFRDLAERERATRAEVREKLAAIARASNNANS